MVFKVDFDGKKNDWEGIVLVDFVEWEIIRYWYFQLISKVSSRDSIRNYIGVAKSYKLEQKELQITNIIF